MTVIECKSLPHANYPKTWTVSLLKHNVRTTFDFETPYVMIKS